MKKISSAILIVAYNRFSNFKELFEKIKKHRVKIYISIDGYKNIYDKKIQTEIIDYINKNIKLYNLDIKYRVLRKNLGCRKAMFSALDWFFLYERKGIIFEDDLLPSSSLLKFLDELLIKYEKNKNIFSISGYNFLSHKYLNFDYFFSKYFSGWGFATWRNRWDVVRRYQKNNTFKKLLRTKEWSYFCQFNLEKQYYEKIFKNMILGNIDSWAFIWTLVVAANKGKCIVPSLNLIRNTGYGSISANNVPSKLNYTNSKIYNLKITNHPKKIQINEKYDFLRFKLICRPKNFLYPWRFYFIIKCLIFDPRFFFIKIFNFYQKILKKNN
jgi:hypothetical protein